MRMHTCTYTTTAPQDKDFSGKYLKWTFAKAKDELGVYYDYQPVQAHIVVLHLTLYTL